MKCVFLLALLIAAVTCFPQERQTGCNSFCPMYIITFCGTDGKTYQSNECFIKSQWCSEGRNDYESFSTAHLGPCTGHEHEPTTSTAAP